MCVCVCVCVCLGGGGGGGWGGGGRVETGKLEECQLFSRVLSNWGWGGGLLKGRAIKKHQPTPN